MRKQQKRMMVLATITVFMATSLFLPGLVSAGDMEPPPGLPGPTMKTLDQIPPTWSQKLQCDEIACPRFELVLDGYAVLDKETGLVWERSPGTATLTWGYAMNHCYSKGVGGRKGFRLPTIEELSSLVDPQAGSAPYLPSGHPFNNVQLSQFSSYWSSTTCVSNNNRAASVMYFFSGVMAGCDKDIEGSNIPYVWCVRGGHGNDTWYYPAQ